MIANLSTKSPVKNNAKVCGAVSAAILRREYRKLRLVYYLTPSALIVDKPQDSFLPSSLYPRRPMPCIVSISIAAILELESALDDFGCNRLKEKPRDYSNNFA